MVGYKIKHKFKTMLGVIRYPVFDFILYLVTAYARECPINVTSAPGKHKIHYKLLEVVSKKILMTNNLQK